MVEDISYECIELLDDKNAWEYKVVPYQETAIKISFYTADKGSFDSIKRELVLFLGKEVEATVIEEEQLLYLLSKHYHLEKEAKAQFERSSSTDSVDKILLEAQETGVSDIHFEPYQDNARVRFRKDGHLIEKYSFSIEEYQILVNKIKIKASLDIAEKRLPQDGRILFFLDDQAQHQLDLRVSIVPTLYGEKAVLRLLQSEFKGYTFSSVGMNAQEEKVFRNAIDKPQGLILISGPTGSGKTTTLYTALNYLNDSKKNITTIENPIEYTLKGINQVQLKEEIGLTFPKALKTFLRQDPDIIMVGEIRDESTADMAVRASLTGHLVLSTIHTNSALGILSRLLDLGVPKFLLLDTLSLAVAQRLVRKLCDHCKESRPLDDEELEKLQPYGDFTHATYAVGCSHCQQTGNQGRIAIFDIVELDPDIRRKVINEETLHESGHVNQLQQNALKLLREGMVSLQEIYPILATKF